MRNACAFLFCLFFFLIPTSVLAEEAPLSFAKAVKLAAPSVVNIYTAGPEGSGDAAGPVNSSSQTEPDREPRTDYRLGSGVILDKEGHILSNYHVIMKAKEILVVLPDGRKVSAKVMGSDPETDLAVLKISANNLLPISLGDSRDVQVGDLVLAIGNPFGLGQTVTHGIVSAIGRNTAGINQLENYIQIDAAINPGNSGGALVNTQGKLVGITVGIYSRSGGFQGVGFAIPVDVAISVMNQIIKNGRVERGYLGVNVLNIPDAKGVMVVQVVASSPAAAAGLKVNDVIISVNEHRVSNVLDFQNYIALREPGSHLLLKVIRQDKEMEINAKAGVRPPPPILDDRGQPHLPGERKDLPDHVG